MLVELYSSHCSIILRLHAHLRFQFRPSGFRIVSTSPTHCTCLHVAISSIPSPARAIQSSQLEAIGHSPAHERKGRTKIRCKLGGVRKRCIYAHPTNSKSCHETHVQLLCSSSGTHISLIPTILRTVLLFATYSPRILLYKKRNLSV